MTQPLAKDDFAPVPSTQGAFYAPDGRIVYTHERDAMIRGERRGSFRLFLDRLGLRKIHNQAPRHPQRDLNGH